MGPSHLTRFLDEHVARIEPLERRLHLAYWNATISGLPADFQRYAEIEIEMQRIYADRAVFQRVRAWREDGSAHDAVQARQVDLLYRLYARNQVDPELLERMTRLATDIANQFNVFRAQVDGRTLTSNEVRAVLRESTDSDLRRRVWEAEKRVGAVVRDDLLDLVRLRNRAARALGFDDYYVMSLTLDEQDPDDVFSLFDRLDALTRAPFATFKAEVDARLAERYAIPVGDLRPWHYEDPFFQEAPQARDVDLDGYFRGHDIAAVVGGFYRGIGLDVSEVLARSDLYEKPGKEQHAYCIDIDRAGDVRVLANIRDDENWAGTMLHELGHAVYDRSIDASLPFLLRSHAHVFVTEAIAMLFGRLSKDPAWLQHILGLDDRQRREIEPALLHNRTFAQLVFARWCQVMVRFERELYRDPDQDLDGLWWDLVREYQAIAPAEPRRAPDWASKIHIVSAPVYYHNYMLGEILASQLDHVIHARVVGESAVAGRPEVGAYLRDAVFQHGRRHRWDELVEKATGEPLDPVHFVNQFVD